MLSLTGLTMAVLFIDSVMQSDAHISDINHVKNGIFTNVENDLLKSERIRCSLVINHFFFFFLADVFPLLDGELYVEDSSMVRSSSKGTSRYGA